MNKKVKITFLRIFLLFTLSIGIFTVLNWDKIIRVVLNWDRIIRVDQSIALDGYSLSVRDYGKGEPTIIIEPGLCCSKKDYYLLQFLSSFNNRVISYDHAGIGNSTKSSNPRTLPYYVEELKALLKYKNISPPYILIGHSLGGHIIRYYTYLYPHEVAGLIFLDHPHEDWFRYIRSEWSIEEQKEYFRFWNPPVDENNSCTLEKLAYEANCDSLRGKEIPSNIPVLMFTGKNLGHFRTDSIGKEQDTKTWVNLQKSLVKSLPLAKQIVDLETGHWPQNDKPLFVQKEINIFIKECCKKKSLNSSLY